MFCNRGSILYTCKLWFLSHSWIELAAFSRIRESTQKRKKLRLHRGYFRGNIHLHLRKAENFNCKLLKNSWVNTENGGSNTAQSLISSFPLFVVFNGASQPQPQPLSFSSQLHWYVYYELCLSCRRGFLLRRPLLPSVHRLHRRGRHWCFGIRWVFAAAAAAAAVGASTAYVSPFAFAAFCASTTFCLPLLLCHRCHPFVSPFAFAAAAIRASTAVVSPFAAAAIGATTALIPLCRGCNPHSFLEIFL